MSTTSKLSVQILVAIAKQRGIKHIVFSPGSRNAPLVIGFNSDPWFECINIPDERAAGFFALGIMQHQRKPVAVCCTSGSAAVNYYPAVAEAFYQKLPLVVLTADRPQAWIDQGDGQTIRQQNVFHNHINYAANLLEDDANEALWFNKRVINEAFDSAVFPDMGPVHINLPFREPLYQISDLPTQAPRQVRTITAKADLNPDDLSRLANKWNNSSKKMVILGQMLPNHALDSWIAAVAADPSVIVFTESASNVRADGMFQCIDRLLAVLTENQTSLLKPQILLTIGGAVISKRIKSFLRLVENLEHWHVHPALPHPDTYQALSEQILARPLDFLVQFVPLIQMGSGSYKTDLTEIDAISDKRHQLFAKVAPWSDWKAFYLTLAKIPDGMDLQSSNSSVIRYLQLFKTGRNVYHFCNRGTSGIDGSTSTAAGYCFASQKPTLLITGDISFFYDSNGLYHQYLPKNFKILLINNGGGGIFRIIEGPRESPYLETYFEAAQHSDASGIAKAFNLSYLSANSEATFCEMMEVFFLENQPVVLEVFTPRSENAVVLNSYFKALKND
jgi:2-succinyl-5-enolpyruvyl-6-hydroxy-3-cyclohexene-1-carboxylate synthase